MSLDEQALAGVKNRVGKWQLMSELQQIEKEKKAEMRMHNTAKQRFKAKYFKFEHILDRGKDAADVRMYETHNPGFCYRRNGECRIPQITSPNHSVDYNDIYSLLFTDGEVDIEKVLCLHLLTAHRTETLTPPLKNNRPLSVLAKNQSPLERLIERSKKKRQEDSVTKMLPTYILDVKTTKPGEEYAKRESDIVIRDGRLAARVIINDKIVQLVHIVMTALQHTNPEKNNDLLKMATDVALIKGLIGKPNVIEFLGTLNGYTLICSCESFHLTQPFKAVTVPLELEVSPSSTLAKLLNYIRKNILQMPSQSTAKNLCCKSQIIKEESKTDVMSRPKSSTKSKDSSSMSSKGTSSQAENADVQPSTSRKGSNKNRDSSVGSRGSKSSSSKKKVDTKNSASSVFPSFMDFLDEKKNDKNEFDVSFINKKSKRAESSKNKNRKNAFGSETKNEDFFTSGTELFSRLDVRAVAAMISDKALAAHARDLEDLDVDQENSEDTRKSPKVPPEQGKVSIKHMTCPACMQKWKIPLPNPKTPKIKKVSVPTLEQAPYNEFKSGSAQRLSLMIDEEMKKLNSESRRQKPSMSKIPFQRDYKGSLLGRQMVDTVDMDALDLAKIAQEIKEKETQKKLMKFLSTTV